MDYMLIYVDSLNAICTVPFFFYQSALELARELKKHGVTSFTILRMSDARTMATSY